MPRRTLCFYVPRRRVGNGDFIDMAWMAREIARRLRFAAALQFVAIPR